MPRCSFTFGQIEELLVKAHRIAPEKRTAFQGRLKHLQRWGFPSGEKPGKGRAISYSTEHVFMMVLAMELIQSGMPPKLSADLIRDNWEAIRITLYLNFSDEVERVSATGKTSDDWCWLIRPEALREITFEGVSEFDHFDAVQAVELGSLPMHLAAEEGSLGGGYGRNWRTLIINGGPLVRGIARLIEVEFGWATSVDLRSDLLEANDKRSQFLRDALHALEGESECLSSVSSLKLTVAERYPAEIIDMAMGLINKHAPLLNKLIFKESESIELCRDELSELHKSGVLSVEVEGFVFTDKGLLIQEILQERGSIG